MKYLDELFEELEHSVFETESWSKSTQEEINKELERSDILREEEKQRYFDRMQKLVLVRIYQQSSWEQYQSERARYHREYIRIKHQ
ncbi:hypothetical protein J4417_04730 [Candidatus Woesearchaeota archaeon]|nr:hypothetical protein [Candidatus Woesearchaeota archaeon]HLC80576.1 hypothetical protein [Candidatus Nanoarchaeia archaeon]